MLRLALKTVRHNPKRLIMTAMAVALGVALVSSVFTFTSALSRGFGDLFSSIYSTVDVVVEPDPKADVDPMSKAGLFTTADVAAIGALPGVTAAKGGVAYEMGSLLNAAGDAPLEQGPPTLLYNWTGNSDLDRATLIDGRAPAADDEVVVDVDTFKKLDDQARRNREARVRDRRARPHGRRHRAVWREQRPPDREPHVRQRGHGPHHWRRPDELQHHRGPHGRRRLAVRRGQRDQAHPAQGRQGHHGRGQGQGTNRSAQ